MIILLLPIPTIWTLNIAHRRKVAVICVLSFGISAVIVAACRFEILSELARDPDISFVLGKMIIVAGIEIQLAIIAVNLPSLGPLYKKLTGGSTAKGSAPFLNHGLQSRPYELSSLGQRRDRSKRSKAGPLEDINVTHAVTVNGTRNGSEEELWKHNGQDNQIVVTRNVYMDTSLEENSNAGWKDRFD